jgi:hypothetical protein
MAHGSEQLRALLQEFVEARLDAPELFARAGALLPPEGDPYEEILELLAEADLHLNLATGRQAFIRRLEQYAAGDSSYTELDLWGFSLGQTDALSTETTVSVDAETNLLRELVDWIEQWEDEAVRPAPEQVGELAQILAREPNPGRCLAALEEALDRFGRS